ncbi:MAG: 4Fe-4S binding protein [Clostridiales bacterium]|nr:4Fe-4S binding protein [Clostridiales bacterium]
MKIYKIVFSPTGGTEKDVDFLTAKAGSDVNKVDLADPNCDFKALNLGCEDLAFIAVPSYGGRVPALATERLSQIEGNNAYCVLVCVYGNRAYEDTLVELKDAAEKSGFRVVSAVAAVAEHSIVRQYAAGRTDSKDEAELNSFGEKILEKIKSGVDEKTDLEIPGNRPYKKSGKGGLVPKADSKCNGCGLCAEKCPSQAISRDDPKSTDGEKCIHCMRCVSVCPQSARKVNKAAVSAVALALKLVCSDRKNNELFI